MNDTSQTSDPIGEAIADLTSRRRGRQQAGHERLLQMSEPDSLWHEALLERMDELLAHKNAQVRGSAYLALANAAGEGALSTLLEHLDESEGDARLDLVEALIMAGRAAWPTLEKFLGDELFEIRFAAAGGLIESGHERCYDVLREGLGFDDTRYLALSGLYRLGDRRALEPARAIFGKLFVSGFERVAAAGVLAKLGDMDGRRFLIDRAARRRGLERGLAIEILGELKVGESFDALLTCLNDPRDPFRGAAARSLGALGRPEALEPLKTVLFDADEDPDLRMDAAEGLMNLKTPEARETLQNAQATLSAVLSASEEAAAELRTVLDEALSHFDAADIFPAGDTDGMDKREDK